MSIVCSICQDSIAEKPQCLTDREELVSVALTCGHLFHKVCIQLWFQNRGANSVNRSLVDCPFCKKSSSLSNALRIWPTSDELGTEVSQSSAEQVESERKTRKQLEDLRKSKEQLEVLLTLERNEHDALKSSHGRLHSRLRQLQEDISEVRETYATLEESLKDRIEKLEKDNEDARITLDEMKISDDRIKGQLELLKTCLESRRTNPDEKTVEDDLVDQLLIEISGRQRRP